MPIHIEGLTAETEFVGALDCGTSSTRFILFDQHANVVLQYQTEFPQYHPHPGWHEHDPLELVESVQTCFEGVVSQMQAAHISVTAIKAIGITNQRETTVVWDKQTGRPLMNAIVWDDARNIATVKRLADQGGSVDSLKDRTGMPLTTYFSGTKLAWMLEHNVEVKKAHDEDRLAFGTVDSWLLYNLTGGLNKGLHVIDITNASRTMLMNITTSQWDDSLLGFFGLKGNILPEIRSSSEIYGHMEGGVLAGVPIAGMLGDQQAALVGQKCLRAGEAKNTYGTGAFLLLNTGEEVKYSENGLISTVAYQAGPNTKPHYALEGSIAVAGSAIQWLRDSLQIIDSAPVINDLAGSVKNTGGVYFVTAFAGLFAPYWDTRATGTLIGVTAYTTKAHIARATLEASCYQTRAILDAMNADSGVPITALRVDGGITNSDLAMQIQSDILGEGVVVERPAMRESTALGSAICAASAIGLFGWDVSKPETLSQCNTAGKSTFSPALPEKTRAKRWRGWNRAVERSRAWVEEDVSEDEE